MKNNLQTNPMIFKMVILVTCLMLATLYNKARAESGGGVGIKMAKVERVSGK